MDTGYSYLNLILDKLLTVSTKLSVVHFLDGCVLKYANFDVRIEHNTEIICV